MTPPQGPETYTYRGRSLEELVPRIRSELGDDAVIVARRETTSGGVGGFFAKREIEVEVRPGSEVAPHVAAAFAQQLAEAHERQQGSEPAELSRGRRVSGCPGPTSARGAATPPSSAAAVRPRGPRSTRCRPRPTSPSTTCSR